MMYICCTAPVALSQLIVQECAFFFGPSCPGRIPVSENTSLAIIKPHIIVAKQTGAMLRDITASFTIKAMELFNVDKRVAGEFYEVYRGVVATSEYTGMVDELTSGPCLVMELAHPCVPSLTMLFAE